MKHVYMDMFSEMENKRTQCYANASLDWSTLAFKAGCLQTAQPVGTLRHFEQPKSNSMASPFFAAVSGVDVAFIFMGFIAFMGFLVGGAACTWQSLT